MCAMLALVMVARDAEITCSEMVLVIAADMCAMLELVVFITAEIT